MFKKSRAKVSAGLGLKRKEEKKRKEDQARKESKQNKDLSIQAKGTIKRLTVWEALVQILASVLKTTEHEAF